MKKHVAFLADVIPTGAVQAVKAKASAYGFCDRKRAEQRQTAFEELWPEAFTPMGQVTKDCTVRLDYEIAPMPWNSRRA